MTLRYDMHKKTGNLNTLVAGTTTGGEAVLVNTNERRRIEALSAIVEVDAETENLTITGKWQVSNNGTTWFDLAHGTQNAAGVALATGTSGADPAVKRVFQAPDAVYGWRHARFAIVNGAATGTTNDTYEISYAYRALR